MEKVHDRANPNPHNTIAEFCRRNHIRKMSLFGSVIRDDFTPESDVDILVEFAPGFAYFDMERDLSKIFGRKVDLNTPSELSKYFRQEVLEEAEDIYVEA